ncbi:MAG: hypothetical protein U0805_20820 [Pirellulales bacterium]
MAAIAIAGVVIRDYVQLRAARKQLKYTLAAYEAQQVCRTDAITASREMAATEAKSLWISDRTAKLAHIPRIYRMMRALHSGACELNPDEID